MKKAPPRSESAATASPNVSAELLTQAQNYLNRRKNEGLATGALEAAWSDFYDLCTRKITEEENKA